MGCKQRHTRLNINKTRFTSSHYMPASTSAWNHNNINIKYLFFTILHLNIKYTTISFPKSIWTWNLGIYVEATYYLLTTNHYKICCHNFVFRVPRERKILSLHFAYFIHCHDNSEKIYNAIKHTEITILWKKTGSIYWYIGH